MAKISFLTGGTNETTLDGISRAVTRNYTSPGCIGDNDLKVTQNTTPDNKVLISTGSALIGFNSPSGTQEDKYYHLFADVAETVTITANTSGNPRIDAIVSYPDVSGGSPNDNDGAGKFVAIAGTPAATPSAPTDANIVTALGAGVPYTVHAHVAAANGFTSITNANITDMRVFADTNDRVIGDTASDFVASGLLWSASAGLVGAMTGGRAYIGGKHVNKSALTHTFTASKDTYVDLPSTARHSNHDDLTYTEVALGAASPALAAGSLRLAKVVTNGSAITSATVIGWDSRGNAIRQTNPNATTLGYVDIASGATTSSTSAVAVSGLSLTVLIPDNNRRVKVTAWCGILRNLTAGKYAYMEIWDGTVGSGTLLAIGQTYGGDADEAAPATIMSVNTPSAGSKTYNVGIRTDPGGTTSLGAAAEERAFILVELI